MNKKILIVLFLIFVHFGYSQKQELGKVSIEELNEKKNSKDSTATAAILFKKGNVKFEYSQDDGFSMVTTVNYKIKIYKKEGYEWANYFEPYYVGGNVKESVIFSNANTYNLVDGKIEKTKLKSNGEFDESINKLWSRKKIVLPNVKEGSIIEFQSIHKTTYINSIKEWEFQTGIPVNFSEFILYIPEYFKYNSNQKGFINPKIVNESKQRVISYSYTTKSIPGLTTQIPETVKAELAFKENIITYQTSNLPGMKEEAFVNNIDNYTASVSHELSKIEYPNESPKTFSTDWESVVRTIYENDDFGSQLSKNNYFENDLKTLLYGISSSSEKMMTIYNYVKSNVKWNGFYGYLTDVGVKKAFQNKIGNVAEINLMLVSMLRFAEIDSNPVLISTRSNGISFFPTRTGFNYIIASAEIDGKTILLDATDKNSLPNILPLRVLNWNGRAIENNGDSQILNVMPEFKSGNSINFIASIDQKGEVSGKLREQYSDYYAFKFRENLGLLANDAIIEKIEKNNPGLEVSDYEVTNQNILSEPVVEKYSFKNTNASEIIGDKIYFSPMLHLTLKQNPFKQEKREYPIDFSFPTKNNYRINITIPTGYVVENLPKSGKINMKNNYGNFSYTISNTENQIQLSLELNINSSIIPPEDYETIKEFYKLFIEKNNEKVVLRKA